MDDLTQAVSRVLGAASAPLRLDQVADELDVPVGEVDQCLWSQPDRFMWQPGHRWTLAQQKARFVEGLDAETEQLKESRSHNPQLSRELKAMTLANGLDLRVIAEPTDSQAFFSVRPGGAELNLVVNSSHPIFQDFPMPFTDDERSWGARALLELLLEAWALYESSLPPGAEKRQLQEVRMLWGRRALELLEDGE